MGISASRIISAGSGPSNPVSSFGSSSPPPSRSPSFFSAAQQASHGVLALVEELAGVVDKLVLGFEDSLLVEVEQGIEGEPDRLRVRPAQRNRRAQAEPAVDREVAAHHVPGRIVRVVAVGEIVADQGLARRGIGEVGRDLVAQVLEEARVGRARLLGLVDQRLELPRERVERGVAFGLGAFRAPLGIARVLIGGSRQSQRAGEEDGDEEPSQHGAPPVWLHRKGRP